MAADQQWERLAGLFESMVPLGPAARDEALASLSGDDAPLRDRLTAMLAADAAADHPLDRDLGTTAHTLLNEAEPPRQVGPYQLDRILGEGGSAVVYLATRPDVGHQVAIKFLRDAWLSPARRERFVSEQRTLAQLHHPAIATFHDADVLPDGTPWLAMEYVSGAPLTDYCERHRPGLLDRLRLVRRAAEGVRYAHQRAIIHRDLKPSNILVTDEGEVKLVDFGIAKHLEPDGSDPATRTGLRMLTPGYAAPEQKGDGPAGTFTDVYALGVVLYQLLAGRLPFDPSAADHEAAAPVSIAMTGRAELAKHLRADLDVLVSTAMHPDPVRRYRDMDALIRDIDHFLTGQPLEARPDSLGYRTAKFVRRHATVVAGATSAVAAAVALVTFYTVRLREARDRAVAETARAETVQRFTQNLFEGGDPSAAPADTLRVLTLLERGVREARSLVSDPRTQAELLFTLGTIYHKLGDLPRADTLLNESLGERTTEARTGDRLVAVALLRMDQARFDEADSLVRQAMALHGASQPAGDPVHANDRVALGRILEARGDYPGALTVLNEAVALLAQRDTTSVDYVAATTALANTHFYAGQYDEADQLNRRILALDRERHGPRHPSVAEDLINLGAAQFERGKYPEAETFYREALAITRGWYGEDHHATAANLTMLGRALVRAERWDEAVSILEQALAIRERVFGPGHPNVASTVNELGTVMLRRERFPEAERLYQRAAAIYREAYAGRHYLIGIALSNLGSVRMGQKDFIGAERVLREAVAMFEGTLPPEHSNIAIGRIKLGRALLGQRKYQATIDEAGAGYRMLAKQATPAMSFLKNARADLAAAHSALGQPAEAARYREDSTAGSPPR